MERICLDFNTKMMMRSHIARTPHVEFATAMRASLVALVLASLAHFARAAVHEYDDASLYAVSNAAIFVAGREGLFASRVDLNTSTTRAKAWVGANPHVSDGRAYIRFDNVAFVRSEAVAKAGGANQGANGLIEAVTFDARAYDAIGVYDTDGSSGRKFCCDDDMVQRGVCARAGRAIVDRSARSDGAAAPWTSEIWFDDDNVEARAFEEAMSVEVTGMYYVWFVVCDPEHAGVRVRGKTIWKNPDGYLPGMKAPNLKFFGFLAMAYLALGFSWAVAYVAHWKELLELQNCITAVVALGMCETAVWYFDYANFNATGFRPYLATIFAVLLGSMRTTLSRALVLVVSMGYGVVRPTLGGLSTKVIALSVCYFFSAAMKDVVEHVGTVDDLKPGAKMFLILPVSVFDAIFLIWTFTSLSKTLTQLLLRRQSQKLALYRVFTNALALAAAFSLFWLGFEVWFKSTDMIDQKWESVWLVGAFWHILSFAVLCVICMLWRPTDAASRYAYSDMANDNISEESWWNQLIDDEESRTTKGASTPGERVMSSAKKNRALHDFSLDEDDAEQLEMEIGKME